MFVPLRALSLPCPGWEDDGVGVAVNVTGRRERAILLSKLRSTLVLSKRGFVLRGGALTASGPDSAGGSIHIGVSPVSVNSSPLRRGRFLGVLAAIASC